MTCTGEGEGGGKGEGGSEGKGGGEGEGECAGGIALWLEDAKA